MKKLFLIGLLTVILAACGAQSRESGPGLDEAGLTARHQAEIPAAYAGLTNPVPADKASVERGAELYRTNCASCHGDDGMGDGPAGATLDPPPAPIAQTSNTMGDDYLFWRISEGGAPFNTSMPPWKFLDEQARWDLVNYIRALGAEAGQPSITR